MTKKYKIRAIRTAYWRPGDDFIHRIVKAIEPLIQEGDFVTVSEKAISTALGNLLDESTVQPGFTARLVAKIWMRIIWPYVLGPLCHLRWKTRQYLRAYPIPEGSAHKEVALKHGGFLQTLMFGSEGAIDGSNLPYAYVSLPLKNPVQIAQKIQREVEYELKKQITTIIVDTDKTYTLKNLHFTPRPHPITGIHSFGGIIAYLVGRFFQLKRRATPIAVAGAINIGVEEALEIAKMANRSRSAGAGRNVWDMAQTFQVSITGVTWEMLDHVQHYPIVLVRPQRPPSP